MIKKFSQKLNVNKASITKIGVGAAQVAVMAGLAAIIVPVDAFANNGIGGIFNNLVTNLNRAPALISMVSYLAGAGIGMAGIFKLKVHAENPGQVPLSHGLMRLGAAGALIGLPFVLQAMATTINSGNNTLNQRPNVGTFNPN